MGTQLDLFQHDQPKPETEPRAGACPPGEESPEAAAEGLRTELVRLTGLPLALTITNNRRSMLYFKQGRDGVYRLRLHRMFLDAGPRVVRALGAWLADPRGKRPGAVIDEFIRGRRHTLPPGRTRRTPLRTRGRIHDLAAIYQDLNHRFFGGKVEMSITWGRMPASRPRKSIHFGTCSHGEKLIRIHPLLDQDFVPGYFVAFIVFHEMLHACLGYKLSAGGRRMVHTAEFRRLERAYPEYKRARAWEARPENMKRLLGRTRGRRS